MKRIFALVMCIVMLLSMGCTKETEEINVKETGTEDNVVQGGMLTVSSRRPDTFNPLSTNYESCRELLYLFYDGLFTLDEDFNVKRNLVAEYTMAKDCLSIRIKVKDGITFADGSSLSSDDVKYTIDYIRENGGSFSGCVKNIKSVVINDDDEIVLELYNPEANFA
ncbi:MAG: ABC transporter substrate-binding protein, partial [Clostridia bacterium]|nr:ABC transporter substrate-binding protein [Clostridia bacterium]